MRPLDVLHPTPRPLARARALRNAALCALTFTLCVALLGATLPERGGLHTDAKLDAFEARKDEIDVVFLGSSRTYRGFVPRIFDEELAARGHAFQAFNLGVMGNRATESLEVLKRIARMRPEALRWVLVDPEPLDMIVDERQPRSLRVIDWHDVQATRDVTRLVLATDRPFREQLALLWRQWIPFAYHTLNIGSAQPFVNELLGRGFPAAERAAFLGPDGDGYRPMDLNIVERAAKGDAYGEQLVRQFPVRVAQLVAARAARPRPGPALAPERAVFFDRIEDLAAELGARTVFVVQPTVLPREELLAAGEQRVVEHLLDYGDPEQHPEFYTLEARYDIAHASAAGAEAFTRALARDFARLLDAEDRRE